MSKEQNMFTKTTTFVVHEIY